LRNRSPEYFLRAKHTGVREVVDCQELAARPPGPHTASLRVPSLKRSGYQIVIEALGCTPDHYTLASLRYDLSKLRAKGLVAKIPNSRRYQLLPQGYSICLVFLKLFERLYAPLTAGLLTPAK